MSLQDVEEEEEEEECTRCRSLEGEAAAEEGVEDDPRRPRVAQLPVVVRHLLRIRGQEEEVEVAASVVAVAALEKQGRHATQASGGVSLWCRALWY